MRYKQLTLQETYQIKCLQKIGFSISFIANRLNRHKSTISREVRRNKGLRGYRAKQAHQIAVLRRISHIKVRISYGLWQEVRRLISEEWSPEQISGRIKAEQGECISVEWIYQYIYKDKARGGGGSETDDRTRVSRGGAHRAAGERSAPPGGNRESPRAVGPADSAAGKGAAENHRRSAFSRLGTEGAATTADRTQKKEEYDYGRRV